MLNLKYELSRIDLFALVEADLGQPHQKSRKWAMWLCPFHADQKTPSFGVNLEKGYWRCFGCNRSGDALTWMTAYRKLTYAEALQELHLNDHWQATSVLIPKPYRPVPRPPVSERPSPESSEAWQKRGQAFLEYARSQLWQTPEALAYLHEKRLLEDITIRHFSLGYNPSDLWDRPERWGLSCAQAKRIWLPKGYVIPCFAEEELWYIKIRRLDAEPKYMHVSGGVPALFGIDSLAGAPLVLLTEGEFDCMLTWQLLRDVAGMATLGSASKQLDLNHWGRYLLPAEEILVVLDSDAAGMQGAQTLSSLSAQMHPVRIPALNPQAKDITDFVRDGGDLWAWLDHQLEALEQREGGGNDAAAE